MPTPTTGGYLVHVVIPTPEGLACRPAVPVVDVYGDGHMLDATVFLDASDYPAGAPFLTAPNVEHSLEGRVNTYHLWREHQGVTLPTLSPEEQAAYDQAFGLPDQAESGPAGEGEGDAGTDPVVAAADEPRGQADQAAGDVDPDQAATGD